MRHQVPRKLIPLLATLAALTFCAPNAAASGPMSPDAGKTLYGWIFMDTGNDPQGIRANVVFDYGAAGFEELPLPSGSDPLLPKGGYGTVDHGWGDFDNPAPLIWYTAHVCGQSCDTSIGAIAFARDVNWNPSLVQVMNREHFAPAMIGGVNPPGVTTSPGSTWADADGWIFPNGQNGKAVLKQSFGKVYLSGAAAAAPTPAAPPTATTGTVTKTAGGVSPTRSDTSPPPTVASPVAGGQPEPSPVVQSRPPQQIQTILHQDMQSVALARQVPERPQGTSMWQRVGGVAAALAAAVALVAIRRRRRRRFEWNE